MGEHDRYGIIIDSGSSGSRLQVYKWTDPVFLQESSKDENILRSIPKIVQEDNWSYKISPGISSFKDRPSHVWDEHFRHLMEYAEKIIPLDQQAETPIFVLATAGMRMVQETPRFKILNNVCTGINKHSNFYIPDCQNHVRVIDGETEGLFGWIGLNYLMGQFDNYDQNQDHTSFGFMDMGGASTQIAFVPSNKSEISKHTNDLFTVNLRNVNGDTQSWKVFVSTWLGFGANEARRRHLKNAISSLPENIDTKEEYDKYLFDPCSPKDVVIDFQYNNKDYKIKGLGDYEVCLKDIYPLLLKHLPCDDNPCLFNGVHAPQIDFKEDKFVGVSEYWYTANDVFNMGGEYNFLKFNEKVKEFCSEEWATISSNFEAGKYGENMKLEYLKDSCFKASWVINILHEGFGLPRIGIDTSYLSEDQLKSLNSENNELEQAKNLQHIPSFQSVNLVEGAELSWTLGKMLLYVSNQIPSKDNNDNVYRIGIIPSENSLLSAGQSLESTNSNIENKIDFKATASSSGRNSVNNKYIINNDANSTSMTSLAILVILIGFIFFALYRTGIHRFKFLNFSAGSLISKTKLTVRRYYNKFILRNLNKEEISLSDLEEGLMNLYKNQDVQSQEGSLLPPVAIISQHDEDNDSVNFKSISFGNEERPGRIRTRSSVLSFSDLDNMRDYTSKKLANGVTMGISTSNNSSPNLGGPETNNNAKLTRSFTHTNINQYQQHQHQQPSWYGIGVNHGGIVINGNSNEAGSDKKNLRRTVSTNVLKSNNNISTNKDN